MFFNFTVRGAMQEIEFQCWLARTPNLTPYQSQVALSVFQGKNSSVVSILENTRPLRECPHCHSSDAVKRGFASGLQRYQCKFCKKTFNSLTGTPLSRLRHKEQWLSYTAELIEGSSVRKIAKITRVATTFFATI